MIRRTISILLWLMFLVFGYATLTVPMIAAAAPAIITVACAAAAWLVWPKRGPAS